MSEGPKFDSADQRAIREGEGAPPKSNEGADPASDMQNSGNQIESADDVAQDDPHKTEKLVKAGRDIDPNAGAD